MKKKLASLYLDWVKNWLTVERMAEHYNMQPERMLRAIYLGRIIHHLHLPA